MSGVMPLEPTPSFTHNNREEMRVVATPWLVSYGQVVIDSLGGLWPQKPWCGKIGIFLHQEEYTELEGEL
jgi:hypothetical protein